MQTWDKTANNGEGAYVDVKVDGDIIKVYPGDNFMVRADYARITPDPDHAGKNFYTVQLRAAYGKKDGPEPTHIKWYSNIYDVAGNKFIDTETKGDMNHPTNATWNENGGWYIQQENVQINNAVPIPTPPYSMEGYTFLGWGRVCDPDSVPEGDRADVYVTDPSALTEEDLYIKWVPEQTVDGVTTAAHYEALMPPKPDALSQDYYLVGYINGSDVNGTDYLIPKSSGQFSMTFTQKSYLAIRTSDNHWYKMYNGDFSDPAETPMSGSAILYDESNNNDQKIPVPAGVQVNVKLKELKDDNGRIYGVEISYTTGVAPAGNVVPSGLRAEDGEELSWQTVQYVAADEEKPYHDMYAIWGGEFYVYHSGIEGGAVETYPITRDSKTLDLTRYYVANRDSTDPHAGEYQNRGFLYGGYYLSDGVTLPTGVTFADNSLAYGEAVVEGNTYIPAYDGTNWTWTTPVTDAGNAIAPKGGVTYVIKEVPATKYLQPYFHFTYLKESDPANQVLRSAWLISDIDDAMYQETGFVIQTADKTAYVCSQLTVQNAVGGASVVLKPQNIFRAKGVTGGYLSYLEVMNNGAMTNGMGTGITIGQYWVTPDGMIVTGTSTRSYASLDNRGNVKAEGNVTETAVASTIGVFESTSTNP